jgi:hypothetical protein
LRVHAAGSGRIAARRDDAVDKQSGFYPQMTRIIADKSQKICVYRRNLRMEMLFCLSGA